MPARIRYEEAGDVCEMVKRILATGVLPHVDPGRVYCVRSRGARTRAVARIYGVPGPWVAVGFEPGYVIEVVSERFDGLSCRGKLETIVHELLHIPYTFSGALRPHGRLVNGRRVRKILGEAAARAGGLEALCYSR